jgi:hypothetical protein
MALAEWIEDNFGALSMRHFTIAYTPAKGYGHTPAIERVREQYIGAVFAPIGPFNIAAVEEAEGHKSRCVAVLGHERVRARLGTSLVTCHEGVAVLVGNMLDADAGFLAERENEQLLNDMESGLLGSWKVVKTDQQNVESVWDAIAAFMRSSQGRPVLVPLGPKIVCLQVALACLATSRTAVWISCPIPGSYPLDYSHGSLPTVFASVR